MYQENITKIKRKSEIYKKIYLTLDGSFVIFCQDLIAMVYLAGFCTLQHRLPR